MATASSPAPGSYPAFWSDFLRWFPDDAACRDYLDWLRWPDGFRCPHCQAAKGWRLTDGRWSCAGCSRRVSVTAGTIFQDTRTPLTIWFTAAWHMTSQKNGVSALNLRRALGIGSEQTVWAMLHRFRSAMIRPGRDRLTGSVEVDETYLGGPEPGRGGRGALGKTLVAVAVERASGKGLGRCRLGVIPDAGWRSLRAFMLLNIEPGSTIISDGWPAYPTACGTDYVHQPEIIRGSGKQAHELLPGVHRAASLAKR